MRPSNLVSSPAGMADTGLAPLAQALSLAALALGTPFTATAQDAPREMPKLVASDATESPTPKVDTLSSPKFTQELLDTPQTVTVVPQLVLQQQAVSTLTEALRNTPGITMQLGENGNTSAGDTFSIRGTSAQTNIFLDGMRDMGAITRDTFTTEQIEIAKGAVGADFGRGATAGYVNMVSKLPQAQDSIGVDLGVNNAPGIRATGDMNVAVKDGVAVRLNAMWHNMDAVGRDFVENTRWGVAPAVVFGLGTPTRIYLYSQHVRADNVPDGGIPSIGLSGFYNQTLDEAGINPAPVDTENYYGRYDDYEKTKADMATLRVEHSFDGGARVTNSTRWGASNIERVMTGINTLTVTGNPSTWTVSRSRQALFQDNKLLTNQTNLNFDFATGSVKHAVASGVEFIREKQYTPGWTGFGTLPAYLNNGTAINNVAPAVLYNPDAYFAYAAGSYDPQPTGAYSNGRTDTYAGYFFDTLEFTPQWQVTAGARLDHYETDYDGVSISDNTTGEKDYTNLSVSDNLLSWKAGVVFKPLPNGSIYLAYSNSFTPPGGSNFTLSESSTSETNANNPALDPQEAINIELGTKWELIQSRLAVNAALYQTDNLNELSDTDDPQETTQWGKRRVKGIEVGFTGSITRNWQVLGGLAWSKSEIIEGTKAVPNGTTSNNNRPGATARWAPEYSANLWTTYTLNKWAGGLGANYSDEQKRVVDRTLVAQQNMPAIPGYTVWNAMLSYAPAEYLTVQLNVFNLFDKEYISSLNNSGARLRLGTPRYAQVNATFKF